MKMFDYVIQISHLSVFDLVVFIQGVSSIERFFDGPRITTYSMNTYTSESTSRKDITFDPSSYIFTNFEAGKYKEWVVWKFTSKGKQRKRIFAIGFDYINICHISPFNQCNGCGYGNNTYISFSDIIDVQLDENHPGVFSLFYADDYSDYEDSDIARPQEPRLFLLLEMMYRKD